MNKNFTDTHSSAKSSSSWLLLTSASLITAYFNTNLQDPFNTPKMIILMLSASWFLGHLLDFIRNKKIVHKHDNKILILSTMFIVSMLISLIFTDVKITGLIGENQRRNGFFTYLSLTIFFLFSYFSLNFKYAIRLIKVAITTGIILSSYGLMQIFGNDFVLWNNPYNSMISTLGNPNFASAMLAIFFLIAFISFKIKELNLIYKGLILLVCVFSLYAIIKSSSRQGLLVIGFGLVFYIGISLYLNKSKFRYILISSLTFLSVLTILGMLQIGPLTQYLYKDSVSVRGFYWRAGLKMFWEHPLFGVGLDRYGAYFKEFREVDYPLRYGFEITSSNAHNTIIQIFATAGILVGSCYLLILLTIFIRSIKLVIKLDQNERRIVLALLTAWVGFQAQSLISIDNIGISIWNWVLGGSLLGINRYYTIHSGTTSNNSDKKEKKQVVQVNIFQPIISTISVLLTLLVCVPLYNFERSSNIVRGVLQSQNQDTKFMVEKYTNRIISNSWVDPYYKYQAALALADIGELLKSFDVVNGLHLSDSNNLDYLEWLANYYEKNQDFKKAIYYRSLISKYDPWNASNYLILGKLFKQIGDLESMNQMREKILSFASSNYIGKFAAEELI
jgi:O-antigen ligase